MCELFGLSSNQPTDMAASLGLFAQRGGKMADNPDGWGLAYMESGEFQLQKEPTAAAYSERLASLYQTILSDLALAHIRKAKNPPVNTLANTHPFLCTCCGREWVFAHNGTVPDIMGAGATRLKGRCRPTGDTDSEYACYYLLERIAPLFRAKVEPGSSAWLEELAAVSELIASYGQFNFLMSDGRYLIAYGHDRLHSLEQRLEEHQEVLIATEPLTENEPWQAFEPGELRVYHSGDRVARLQTQPKRSTVDTDEQIRA